MLSVVLLSVAAPSKFVYGTSNSQERSWWDHEHENFFFVFWNIKDFGDEEDTNWSGGRENSEDSKTWKNDNKTF